MANSTGTIVQCIGAVVDIQFPIKEMPKVYEALKLISGGSSADLVEEGLTLEVEQQLGDGIVRCIALGSTDGIKRGMSVLSPTWKSACMQMSIGCLESNSQVFFLMQ